MAATRKAAPARTVSAPGLESGQITNFAEGPNFRDSPSELAALETYGSWNVTYDERGGASSRLGYQKRNGSALGTAGEKVVNDYYSPLLNLQLTQVNAKLYRADNTTAVKTFTTNACVTFAEINSLVIACHPVDGLWSSPDGTTWTKITAANAPTTGTNCVATWGARLFVGMSDGSVHWSDPGTVATWTSTNFVSVWMKNQAPIVALHVGSGQDIQGRPGLLVFKQDSVYRINDFSTGAYTVVDATSGAAGPKAVVGVGARVIWIGKRGIFWWREDQAAPVNASDLLAPMWGQDGLNYSTQNGWAAGRYKNRALFSCASNGSSTNDLAFEFHPDFGWIAPRSDAVSCYSTTAGSTETTYGGSPTVDGQLYVLASGGTDDGAAISGWMQTRWILPNGGFQAQLWQVRVHGRGQGTMTVRTDYQDSGGFDNALDLQPNVPTWGSFNWGDGTLWTAAELEASEAFFDIGVCREFSVRFSFTVNSTATGRSLFGNVPAQIVGAFGLYALEYLFVPLGLS